MLFVVTQLRAAVDRCEAAKLSKCYESRVGRSQGSDCGHNMVGYQNVEESIGEPLLKVGLRSGAVLMM